MPASAELLSELLEPEIAVGQRVAEGVHRLRIVGLQREDAPQQPLHFLDAAQAPRGLKILKINGLLPADRAYPLR